MKTEGSLKKTYVHSGQIKRTRDSKQKLSRKIIICVLAVMLASFAVIGLFSYFSYRNDMIAAYAKRAVDLAQSIAVNISAEQIAQYDATDSKDDAYQALIDYLTKMKQITGVEYIYIMTDTGAGYKYIAEGIVEGQAVVSNLGDEDGYDEYGQEPKDVLSSGHALASEIYDGGDEYGDLISAFAPITGSDGKTVAVLGIDIKPTAILQGNIKYLMTVLGVLAGSAVLIFVVLYLVIRRLITKRVNALTAAAQLLAEGEVDVALENKSKDELGELFSSCEVMAGNIKAKAKAARKISKGDLDVQLTASSEKDILAISMNTMIKTLSDFSSELSKIIEAAHDGDFSQRGSESSFSGQYAQMVAGINAILDMAQQAIDSAEDAKSESDRQANSLKELLIKINDSAEQVAEGTGHITAGSQAISQGASDQTYAIEALTFSIAEIAEQSSQNALHAGKVSELTGIAKGYAADGNEKMTQMQNAMRDISESTGSIGRITKVIDDIAFQTNILALNAAVEAARAGAHGKGFAVVAEEVRNLAARSAEAARETAAIVEGSIHRIEAGAKIADQTAAALDSIVNGVEKVEELISEIADASSRQAAGVGQINMGIEQVKQVVKANSETAQEAADASEELFRQASSLKEMAGVFMLNESN